MGQDGQVSDPRALAEALARAGVAEVDISARRRAEYSSDASNYRVVPAAVVRPRDDDEVAAALAAAREVGAPLTARGAGTSIAGNAVGPGLVLDFSRHLNRVRWVDPEARVARVQPGTVLDDVTAAARPHGLRFGPDPSTHSRATIGGAIGNNSCGSRALRYGRTADNVVELDLLTAAGDRLTARRFGRDGLAAAGPVGQALDAVVAGNLGLIRTEFGRFTRQVSGYSLEHLLPENGADLARFLVGSEGTLGVVLDATVRLVASPAAVALAVLGYPDMPTAAEATAGLLPHEPVALEGMDARLVEVVRARRGPAAVPDLPRGGGWLFVETAGATEAEAVAAARRLVADADCLDAAVVTGPAARALWRIREDGSGLGGRTPAGEPAWPGWEDAAVPPERLGPYLREFTALLADHRLDGLVYGHFGDGCVHVRIDFPFAFGRDTKPFRDFMVAGAKLVAAHGGSISGEHGDGRARGELLGHMYSAEALAVFGAVKHAFDPGNVLNPGILVDPRPMDADLRVPLARPLRRGLAYAYPDDQGDLSMAVHRCVGVGRCRADNTADGGVMCPSYLATRDEKDSTRGRARVLQEVANGTLVRGYRARELAESLDLCLSCRGCASDCPTGVDMATYKSEVLYQKYRHRPRPAAHYSLGWLPRLARVASRAPRLANAPLRRGMPSRLAKRLGGIDERRELPEFAARTFRQWFRERRAPAVSPTAGPVLLWVDTFTNHFTPQVGQAAVRVLEAAGYAVGILDNPVCCGLTWISTGQLDTARRQLRRTLDALGPALAAATPVVGLEPSCTAVLRRDVTELLPDDPRAAQVATATRTLAELLTATPGWAPPSLAGVRAVAQPHCHQHAVLGWAADAALLAASGAEVTAVGGCCGLAGNFGAERGHYDVSVAVAETALLPAVRAAAPGTVVLADGFSCRTQLTQLAATRSRHLAQLLDDAGPGRAGDS
ncbi:FAD-binding and (Fe-S)-binding domain-containing protein [Frankia nepalensis]|uniref:FAD-binding protein n=1 Tax=Frankia nepalensis TaxID=1836974 RepID=A0A937RCB5_9ACTN|nr:FAD-binding and (Fe-S)-binding domain-containing protein [Frankia nepalensis]MBL7501797.1 FAD-binding protein [Frankia nepalensis]MBL7513893.1 FAD-binding protein [Frankia nepalensis]MBL7626365.1 FAD-binding protein [Frankia nepalensis]